MGKFGRLLAALTLAGAGLLSVGSPASADTVPNVVFTDACGAVNIQITGAADKTVTYKRNEVVFVTFTWSAGINGMVGAYTGDRLTVTIDRNTSEHNYVAPVGCTQPPAVTFELKSACQGNLVLEINNAGSTAVSGYWLKLDSEEPGSLGNIQPGVTLIPIDFVDDIDVQITGTLGEVSVLWLLVEEVRYRRPEVCDPELMSATFVDTCDGVTVTVTTGTGYWQMYMIVKNPDLESRVAVAVGFVTHGGGPKVHHVSAAAGDEIAVYYPTNPEELKPLAAWAGGGKPFSLTAENYPDMLAIGSRIHAKPASCVGLPVTGFQIGLAAGVGGLLVASGVVIFVMARRRRITA